MNSFLIVEDNAVIRQNIKSIIVNAFSPKHIFEATNSQDAVQIATENDIQLLIVDIGLPDINGLDMVQHLRQKPQYYTTPVIFITADPTKELEAYRNTHCYAYLTKPFSEEKFIDLVKRLSHSVTKAVMKHENKLLLKFKTHSQWIYEKDIYYIEYYNRKIRIYFKDSYIDYKSMPLKDFLSLLSENFLQIHQSIIISLDKIHRISHSEKSVYVLEYSQPLPIGRNFYKDTLAVVLPNSQSC